MSEISLKDLIEKLDWEWEEFSYNVTSLSRENIFSMAEMVADKKRIYETLKTVSQFSVEQLYRMYRMEHVIDTLYIRLPKHYPDLVDEIKRVL
ncbi:MAG: hypothetical protein NC293_03605 [Roseburia sp.]|nr:hypothetical protein [Roseburia sp.]